MSNPIGWCDITWNPVTGCSHVSEGCRHCYAERMAMRRMAPEWKECVCYEPFALEPRRWEDVHCHPKRLDQPLRWRKPRRVFVCSMGDLFHEAVPDDFVVEVFDAMLATPQHTFLILTKRPGRARTMLTPRKARGLPMLSHHLNTWLGVSVEDQATADERIPLLLQTPAAVRFVSIEPMLGPVDLNKRECLIDKRRFKLTLGRYLDWVILGGENGPGARPMHPDWVRSVRDQCQAAGVPLWFKGWGRWKPVHRPFDGSCVVETHCFGDGTQMVAGRGRWKPENGGNLLDGREWHELPASRAANEGRE